jgi:hypothetical protein
MIALAPVIALAERPGLRLEMAAGGVGGGLDSGPKRRHCDAAMMGV